MDQLNGIETMLVGTAGTFVTEVLRLRQLKEAPAMRSFVSWGDLGFSAVYILCGGICAIGLSSSTIQSAFYVGLTWPISVSTIAKHRKRKPPAKFLANSQDIVPVETPHPQALDAARASWFKIFVRVFRDHADGLFL
jgi:hypothetical protein